MYSSYSFITARVNTHTGGCTAEAPLAQAPNRRPPAPSVLHLELAAQRSFPLLCTVFPSEQHPLALV